MITVPDGTRQIIERSRYLSEALSKKLINHTALAKHIQPELEKLLIKKVSIASIVMAIRRLEGHLAPRHSREILFRQSPEILTRSGIALIFIQRTKETEALVESLFLKRVKASFHSIVIGSSEIVLCVSLNIFSATSVRIPPDMLIATQQNCALITIYLPKEIIKKPGVYYFFLKSLAWEEIHILLCTSTASEFTLFFHEKDVHRAHEVISSLFEKKVFER